MTLWRGNKGYGVLSSNDSGMNEMKRMVAKGVIRVQVSVGMLYFHLFGCVCVKAGEISYIRD